MTEHENIKNRPKGFNLHWANWEHQAIVTRMAWSNDGRYLAVPDNSGVIQIWDVESGQVYKAFGKGAEKITSVTWSLDDHLLFCATDTGTVKVWDVKYEQMVKTMRGYAGVIHEICHAPKGRTIAFGADEGVRFIDYEADIARFTPRIRRASTEYDLPNVQSIAWSPDGLQLISFAKRQPSLQLWDATTGKITELFQSSIGFVNRLAWSPDGRTVAVAGLDFTIRIWDVKAGHETTILENHTKIVTALSFSQGGQLLASKGYDDTVRIWRCDTWEMVGLIEESSSTEWLPGVLFNPKRSVMASTSALDTAVRIWDVEATLILETKGSSVLYTNAKVVLLGDTGVGKSGLSLVLTGNQFTATESTHGRRVWLLDSEKVKVNENQEETREIMLWDMAGQPGYRLINQLHLHEVAVALVVFDSRNELDPFAGVRHWVRALNQARFSRSSDFVPIRKFLVAARADRGGIGVSKGRFDSLIEEFGFDAYYETSSREGWNVKELGDAIRKAINWQALPRISSTELFRQIKRFILSEKEAGRIIVTEHELFGRFMGRDLVPAGIEQLREQFTACLGRVESQGMVRRLTFGNLVVLQPELMDAYASALVHEAKAEPDGLGFILEEKARNGEFRISHDERVQSKQQERLLITAVIEDLLRHEIALRQPSEKGNLIVFPSQLTREWPYTPDASGTEVIFDFEGPVMNVYSTLAVRLCNTGVFDKRDMWRNAAVYLAKTGGVCGMYMNDFDEGRAVLTLFFNNDTAEESREQFETYVHSHLLRRANAPSIKRRRLVVCPQCSEIFTDKQVQKRKERGFEFLNCCVCDQKISLVEIERQRTDDQSVILRKMDSLADSRRDFEADMMSASAEVQTMDFKSWVGSTQATLSIVFTDIVGSTRLGFELGSEEMEKVRLAHFRKGRELIKKYRGYEIKTIGDAFMIAFHSATDALDFALACYKETGHPAIKVRFGMHVGQARVEGQDIFGTTVNFAARVVGLIKGAEIWVSGRMKSDIEEKNDPHHARIEWEMHEDCELKGFPLRYTLWSVKNI